MKKGIALLYLGAVITAAGQTLYTQSTNQNIWDNNAEACVTSGPGTVQNNSFIRVFHNDDFNIQDTVFFVAIELGIESTTGGSYELIGRIHNLEGDLQFANMTLLAADTAAVFPDSGLYKMKIPVKEGYTFPGDSIVVEVFAPINGAVTFLPGSNPYPETAPSYIAAPGCGFPEPTAYSGIGYPTVKLLLNLWVNHKPAMANLDVPVFRDNTFYFLKNDFELSFTDPDNDTIDMIRMETLPSFGVLKKNGAALAIGDTIYSSELDLLTYTPGTGYSGSDGFAIRVRDHAHWANETSAVNIAVLDWNLFLDEPGVTGFQVYPNPAASEVCILTEGNIRELQLCSTDGKILRRFTDQVTGMDVSGLPPGVYLIRGLVDDNWYVQRLVKE